MATKQANSKAEQGSLRAVVFLGLAVIAGLAATVMVYELVQSYKMRIAEAKKPEESVNAIVAAGDLYPGVVITEQDLVQVTIPKKLIPTDVFTSPELVVGQIPRERILANEFVRPDRLANGAEGVGLNALVPEGMRAISINISDGNALSGFLNPGNRVDVIVTIKTENDPEPETITLLQAIPVLAVNSRLKTDASQSTDPDADKQRPQPRSGRPTVTLAVTPEQAEQVANAASQGTITLDLRNDADINTADATNGTTTDELLATDEPVKPDEPAKPKPRKPKVVTPEAPTLTVIKGSQSQDVKLNPNGTMH